MLTIRKKMESIDESLALFEFEECEIATSDEPTDREEIFNISVWPVWQPPRPNVIFEEVPLKMIIDRNHSLVFKCIFCPEKYASTAHLNHHLDSHKIGDRQYRCNQCRKSFSLQHHYSSHLKIHYSEPIFECFICSSVFSSKEILKEHLIKHKLRKNQIINSKKLFLNTFICSECDSAFLDAQIAADHVEYVETSARTCKNISPLIIFRDIVGNLEEKSGGNKNGQSTLFEFCDINEVSNELNHIEHNYIIPIDSSYVEDLLKNYQMCKTRLSSLHHGADVRSNTGGHEVENGNLSSLNHGADVRSNTGGHEVENGNKTTTNSVVFHRNVASDDREQNISKRRRRLTGCKDKKNIDGNCEGNRNLLTLDKYKAGFMFDMRSKSFVCKYCGIKFASKMFVRHHLSLHFNSSNFYCKCCGNSFTHITDYLIHQDFRDEKPEIVNFNDESLKYVCTVCETQLQEMFECELHLKSFHRDKVNTTNRTLEYILSFFQRASPPARNLNLRKCGICLEILTRTKIKVHYDLHFKSKSYEVPGIIKKHCVHCPGALSCQQVESNSQQLNLIKQNNSHDVTHSGQAMYDCRHCTNYSTLDLQAMHSHVNQTHLIKMIIRKDRKTHRFLCKSCGMKYCTKQNFFKHITSQISIRRECVTRETEDCGGRVHRDRCNSTASTSGTTQDVIQRTKQTPNTQPVNKEIEDVTYESSSEYQAIMDSVGSGNEEVYSCHLCPLKTNKKANLERHLQYHKNFNSFICFYCCKKFPSKELMLSHENEHLDNTINCDNCPQTFENIADLIDHLDVCKIQPTPTEKSSQFSRGSKTVASNAEIRNQEQISDTFNTGAGESSRERTLSCSSVSSLGKRVPSRSYNYATMAPSKNYTQTVTEKSHVRDTETIENLSEFPINKDISARTEIENHEMISLQINQLASDENDSETLSSSSVDDCNDLEITENHEVISEDIEISSDVIYNEFQINQLASAENDAETLSSSSVDDSNDLEITENHEVISEDIEISSDVIYNEFQINQLASAENEVETLSSSSVDDCNDLEITENHEVISEDIEISSDVIYNEFQINQLGSPGKTHENTNTFNDLQKVLEVKNEKLISNPVNLDCEIIKEVIYVDDAENTSRSNSLTHAHMPRSSGQDKKLQELKRTQGQVSDLSPSKRPRTDIHSQQQQQQQRVQHEVEVSKDEVPPSDTSGEQGQRSQLPKVKPCNVVLESMIVDEYLQKHKVPPPGSSSRDDDSSGEQGQRSQLPKVKSCNVVLESMTVDEYLQKHKVPPPGSSSRDDNSSGEQGQRSQLPKVKPCNVVLDSITVDEYLQLQKVDGEDSCSDKVSNKENQQLSQPKVKYCSVLLDPEAVNKYLEKQKMKMSIH